MTPDFYLKVAVTLVCIATVVIVIVIVRDWIKNSRDVVVTAKSHPLLFFGFETISHGSGGKAGHDSYTVPEPWSLRVDQYETDLFLAGFVCNLSDEKYQTFLIGEDSESEAICEAHGLQEVDAMFNTMFEEDWRTCCRDKG